MTTTKISTRLRKAWRVTVDDYDGEELYFAHTAGQARMMCWRHMDCARGRIVEIHARRWREKDQVLPGRDPIADTLSKEEMECLLHAFGLNEYEPWKAGYRGHFFTSSKNKTMLGLVDKGLMHPGKAPCWKDTNVYFHLTKLGQHAALSLTPLYGAR
ncbi:hypothetical protein B0W47_00610 [Komagataeibacter nataicola]|uniref:Uncharacterized protein n=1 Tax=Komagataeibacter nataicola TaxID=265960 RepID=A0A9N7C3N1_9PROT|nr:hypothetical protein [Komagataeibacter nataicola]AQU86203.1 hypothetical protein B0W47_00610 [Komagataeibacter nataicola]PYD65337.1 hypothetical protein CDI09_14115 [Komagataeibacter nataicola]WNM08393.1 hypothetical protein RI056_16270 [Komagataeibacter nataicola]GBR23058.1 hypothetical protein AA0616_2432 [Komagataeibacter nataicola NRIC 0616]